MIGDGARTLFWEDLWLGDKKQAEIFPRLYNITFPKLVTIKTVKEAGWDRFTFKRTLHGEHLVQREELKKLIDEVELVDEKDKVLWLLNNKNKFVVKELYVFLKSSPLAGFRGIWKLRVPLKIRVFCG